MEKEGKGLVESTLEASRMRLRPILMTSLAFILGVLPLAISSGAGSGTERRRYRRNGRDGDGHRAGDLLPGVLRGGAPPFQQEQV